MTITFPHGVPPRKKNGLTSSTLIYMVMAAIPSFFLGSITSLYAGIDCSSSATSSSSLVQEQQVQQRIRELSEKLQLRYKDDVELAVQERLKKEQANGACVGGGSDSAATTVMLPPATVGRFLADMARVPKDQVVAELDPGVPLDPSGEGKSEVAVFYSSPHALPDAYQSTGVNNRVLGMPEALENCEQVHLVLLDHSGVRQQCTLLMPQYESFHIQKWMRLNDKGVSDMKEKLQLVSRGQQTRGRDEFEPPRLAETKQHWDMLKNYLETFDQVTAELEPLLKEAAIDNTVIIMVCNFGQSELLMNFVCSAKQRGFDLSHILIFTTDQETTDLAQSLGLKAYFDHRNFGDIPAEAAQRYGDRKFTAMMMAKVICVQIVSMMGYDLMFQDVDIVWYKDPLQFFLDPKSPAKDFDVFFQDDGGHSLRYAPYSANSGFYFVRHNSRSRHFLTTLLMTGDVVLRTKSHQQALIAVLQEHASLHGLKVKVWSRDTEEFPGGYQFNQKKGDYMKAFFRGDIKPYIFHMSWTRNKDNKLLYFKQMGDWWVQEQCVQKKRDEITGGDAGKDLASLCCSAEPLLSCHYRDKPSKIPCHDSPPIDKGRPSFWADTR